MVTEDKGRRMRKERQDILSTGINLPIFLIVLVFSSKVHFYR